MYYILICGYIFYINYVNIDEEAVMATANSTGDIALWDLLDQRIIHVMKGAHNGSISSIQLLNYQALLISSGSDNSVKVCII